MPSTPPTLISRLKSAGLRPERMSRDATSGKLWLVRHVPDASIIRTALPKPSLRYASDATRLHADYAVLLTDKKMQALKAYALYAEAGSFMVVTRFAASSATAASSVTKLLKRIVPADRYMYLFLEGVVPRAMRTGMTKVQFGQLAGYGFVTEDGLRATEAALKNRMARTGRKYLPAPNAVKGSKAVRAETQRKYNKVVKNGLRYTSIPTNFVENRRANRNSSQSTTRSNSNTNNNNGNVRIRRRRPMLLTLRL